MARFILFLTSIFISLVSIGDDRVKEETQVIYVAVASDFLNTFKQIASQFNSKTPYRIVISSGATNTLFMQIQHASPYDVFFSADTSHPDLLKQSGLTLLGQHYVYAIGKLVLWAPDKIITNTGKHYLKSGQYHHLAIANPKVAPYGLAAIDAIKCIKLNERYSTKIIRGENVNQTFGFIATNNAEAGLVGFSQVIQFKKSNGQTSMNDVWIIPTSCYTPIKQEVVLLKNAIHKSVAFELIHFFKQEKARQLIQQAGYELDYNLGM